MPSKIETFNPATAAGGQVEIDLVVTVEKTA